jgi:hypothetical protein
LPVVNSEQVHELIVALEPFRIGLSRRSTTFRNKGASGTTAETAGAGRTSDRTLGLAASLLPVLRAADDPVSAAVDALSDAPKGERHYTAVAAVVALMELGFSDDVIGRALEPIYLDHTDELRRRQATKVFRNAVRWARARIGPDSTAIDASIGDVLQRIAASWESRWRPP